MRDYGPYDRRQALAGTSYVLVTAPVIEPISLEEAKLHARITDVNSDGLLMSYVQAAREEAEAALGFGLLTQTWRYDLSFWSDVIPLPMARDLQSIVSVKYYDGDGTLQTLSSSFYSTDTAARPTALVRASNTAWPTLQADRNTGRIQITYMVGWTAPAFVPERIKQGIRLWVTFLDLNRDGLEDADRAMGAAMQCWTDRMYYVEPSCA